MITDGELLALLEEALELRTQLEALPAEQRLDRFRSLLVPMPRAHRMIIERLYLDGFDLAKAIADVERRRAEAARRLADQVKAPTTPWEALLRALESLWAGPRTRWIWRLLVLVLLALVALFAVWSALPDELQLRLVDGLLGIDLAP